MPNLRGREVPQDHGREQERSERDRDAESDDEFDFGLGEEAKGGTVEESESGRKGSTREKEPAPSKHEVDEAIKGEKTKDDFETANSDERENRSEEADSIRMFSSKTPNQLKAMWRKGQRKKLSNISV